MELNLKKESISVAVAMCTYNGERFIKEQLDSILNQTCSVAEIVIVDDASSDSTLAILRQYEQKCSFIKVLVNESNRGFVYSFQRSISNVTADYVALSDQDDIWTEDHVKLLLDNIDGKVLSVGNCLIMDADAVLTYDNLFDVRNVDYIPESDVGKAYRIVYFQNPYPGTCMLVRRSWLQSLLPFPEGTSFHDIYISMAACLTGGMSVTSRIVNNYRQHPNQVTSKARIPIHREIRHRRHFSYWPDRPIFIKAIEDSGLVISEEAKSFIAEFHQYEEWERDGKRWKMFEMRTKHFRDIFTTKYYKFFFLRSLHFLFSL